MSKKTNNQTPVNEVSKKEEVKAPKFNLKEFGESLQKQFKDNPTVDLVFDTDMTDGKDGGCRATNEIEYRYMHIFRKGTQKNCFQLYTSSKSCEFVVGKSINALIPDSELFTRREVIKAGKVSHLVYTCTHENAPKTLGTLVSAYVQFNAEKAKAQEAKSAEVEAKKAEKAAQKAEKKAEKAKSESKPKKKAEKKTA